MLKKIILAIFFVSINAKCNYEINSKKNALQAKQNIISNSKSDLNLKRKTINFSYNNPKPWQVLLSILIGNFAIGNAKDNIENAKDNLYNICKGNENDQCQEQNDFYLKLKNKFYEHLNNKEKGCSKIIRKNLYIDTLAYDAPTCDYSELLEVYLNDYLNVDQNCEKIIQIKANSGYGKTCGILKYINDLWKDSTNFIPIYIPLPDLYSIKTDFFKKSVLDFYLESYVGLSKQEMKLLGERNLLIIMDGYDELGGNIFNPIKQFNNFKKKKLIVVTRPDYLDQTQELEIFSIGKYKIPSLYICPLTSDKIEIMIDLLIGNKLIKISSSKLKNNFEDLLSNLNIKPTEKFSIHDLTILLKIAINIDNKSNIFINMEKFIKEHEDREVKRVTRRLGNKVKNIKKEIPKFATKQALEMYANYQKSFKKYLWNNQENMLWENFFDEKNRIGREAAPIKYIGRDEYVFKFDSIKNYYIVLGIWKELESDLNISLNSVFNKIFIKEPEILEMFKLKYEENIEIGNKILSKLKKLLKLKNCDKDKVLMRANAITFLNLMQGKNIFVKYPNILQYTCASKQNAYGKWEGPDISNANLKGAYLAGENLKGWNLNDIDFSKTKTCLNMKLEDAKLSQSQSDYIQKNCTGCTIL